MSGFSKGRSGGRDTHGGSRGGRGDDDGGRRGGDRASRGRGRGSSDGGRGRGGGGKNRHMGDIESINAMLRAPGCDNATIQQILNPAARDRDRSGLMRQYATPVVEEWRLNGQVVGAKLDPNRHVVVANFFRVNPATIPRVICQYAVLVYPFDAKVNAFSDQDCAQRDDTRGLLTLFQRLVARHPEWAGIGMAYDGRSLLFCSSRLLFPAGSINGKGEPSISDHLTIPNLDGTESRKRYRVTVTLTVEISMPRDAAEWRQATEQVMRTLDAPYLMSARNGEVEAHPQWLALKSSVFSAVADHKPLSDGICCLRGYFIALKSCFAGLTMIADLTVSAFLSGGPMVNLMAQIAQCPDIPTLVNDARRGLNRNVVVAMEKALKNAKVRLIHLGHNRKMKCLGPPSNHRDSEFDMDGTRVTVAQYFESMCRTNAAYKKCLPKGRLEYPELPTVNIGTPSRPVLVPPELVLVPEGQSRMGMVTGDLTASMIKYSAVRPTERMQFLKDANSYINAMSQDPVVNAFGLGQIEIAPMAVPTRLLPPAELRYADGKIVRPGLAGSWYTDNAKCIQTPPGPTPSGTYTFGVLLVGNGPPRAQDWQQKVTAFVGLLTQDCATFGIRLVSGGNPMTSSSHQSKLEESFTRFIQGRARLVVCMLVDDVYGDVKRAADKLGIITQCVKWKNVDRTPPGLCLNIAIKINPKLGGTNHTLTSRGTSSTSGPAVFQDPRNSMGWICDKPTMLVGMDVSHAEAGSQSESVAAVVGSMDGKFSQYAAHITLQQARQEMISSIETAIKDLFTAFKRKNNAIPQHVVVYRDGVADGQFDLVLRNELPAMKSAVELMGYTEDAVKISIVICQKNHHTRLFYEESKEEKSYLNPCPGITVDAATNDLSNCIVSANLNEFYLTSHYSLQGTSKPCKYSLIYDEIGFKMSELELMTYWSTYLYARCNKSVSYATPAYYAHWASKRGRYLAAAGASSGDLLDITNTWLAKGSSMFFV